MFITIKTRLGLWTEGLGGYGLGMKRLGGNGMGVGEQLRVKNRGKMTRGKCLGAGGGGGGQEMCCYHMFSKLNTNTESK